MVRFLALPAALAAGVALAVLVPEVSSGARTLLAGWTSGPAPAAESGAPAAHGHGDHDHKDHDHADQDQAPRAEGGDHDHDHAEAGAIALSPERIAAAGIAVEAVSGGVLGRSLTVPGTVAPDAQRVARVAAKVSGTVAELRKRLGERVERGEIVAVLDSREVADAKNDYRAALVGHELQQTLFERDHALWDRKISAEQQFLRARTSLVEAQLKVDLARQKLSALGVPDADIQALDTSGVSKLAAGDDEHMVGLRRVPATGLQRYELRAPIAGQVIERRVDLGAPLGQEGQEQEIYTIADLSRVWVELAVPPAEAAAIRAGQAVTLARGTGQGAEAPTPGRIVFVHPMLDPLTRAARVIAEVENPDLAWRPGAFATVRVVLAEEPVRLRLPRAALQTVAGQASAFRRTEAGFERRAVTLGRGDEAFVEVLDGLEPGDRVATQNSFVLKAELGKAEAEHAH
ncbi:efflux RND transporter periplasmic adaptor subunit [Methylobacterium sp. A54F]